MLDRHLRLLLTYKVHIWFIVGLEGRVSGIVMWRGRRVLLLLGGTWPVERSSLRQRGFHRVEVGQSQGLLLLLAGDKVGWGWLEAGLSLRVHIGRRTWTCPAKVLSVVLSWQGLVRFYLHLVRVALGTNLRRLVHFVIENSAQLCCLSGRLRCWYDWYRRFIAINKIVLEFSARFLLLIIDVNKIWWNYIWWWVLNFANIATLIFLLTRIEMIIPSKTGYIFFFYNLIKQRKFTLWTLKLSRCKRRWARKVAIGL